MKYVYLLGIVEQGIADALLSPIVDISLPILKQQQSGFD